MKHRHQCSVGSMNNIVSYYSPPAPEHFIDDHEPQLTLGGALAVSLHPGRFIHSAIKRGIRETNGGPCVWIKVHSTSFYDCAWLNFVLGCTELTDFTRTAGWMAGWLVQKSLRMTDLTILLMMRCVSACQHPVLYIYILVAPPRRNRRWDKQMMMMERDRIYILLLGL